MRSLRRHEVASAGLDDFLATLGDGHGTGLRIPSAVVDFNGNLIDPYLFLLASADMGPGDALVGLSQYLSIALPQAAGEGGTPPIVPYEVPIRTPRWHPPDGFAEWLVTFDNSPPAQVKGNAFDSDSFKYEDATTPALVYETVHFPAAPTAPGYLGLDAYTAPAVLGSVVLELRDLRYPWEAQWAYDALRLYADNNVRVRLYCRIQQTIAGRRPTMPIPASAFTTFPGSLAPEDGLLTLSQDNKLADDTLQYWNVAGRLVFDRGERRRRDMQFGERAAAPLLESSNESP